MHCFCFVLDRNFFFFLFCSDARSEETLSIQIHVATHPRHAFLFVAWDWRCSRDRLSKSCFRSAEELGARLVFCWRRRSAAAMACLALSLQPVNGPDVLLQTYVLFLLSHCAFFLFFRTSVRPNHDDNGVN